MIRFHGYFRSSAAYRCRIALNLKGVEHEFVPVHLLRDGGQHRSPGYRALNPQAMVPTLENDDFVLTQSLAILEWLEEKWPRPPLLPADPDQRAQVRAFALTIACDIHPLQNLRVLQYLRQELAADEAAVSAWLKRWLGEGLAACEAMLARNRTGGDFCFGENPGLADVCLVPQVFSAHRFGIDLADMPRIRAVHAACEALPAFAQAHPARQPDTE